MTTLLVAGLILLVIGMARTARQSEVRTTDGGAVRMGDLHVAIPAGHRLIGSSLSDEALVLHLARGDDSAMVLLIVDLESGAIRRRVLLEPAP